jgi:hypothetical protein
MAVHHPTYRESENWRDRLLREAIRAMTPGALGPLRAFQNWQGSHRGSHGGGNGWKVRSYVCAIVVPALRAGRGPQGVSRLRDGGVPRGLARKRLV